MSQDYAGQKLWEAVSALCGDRSIQARLRSAGLSLLILDESDFDGDERADFANVVKALTQYGHGGEAGTLDVTMAELDDEAAVRIAQQIVDLAASRLF